MWGRKKKNFSHLNLQKLKQQEIDNGIHIAPAAAAPVVEPPASDGSAPGSVSWMDVLRETKNTPKNTAARSNSPSPVAKAATPTAVPKPVSNLKVGNERKSSGGSGRSSPIVHTNSSSPSPTHTPALPPSKARSWVEFLTEVCGLSEEDAKTYANTFKKNDIQEDQIGDINTQILKDLGVKVGHLMRIMKGVRSMKQS